MFALFKVLAIVLMAAGVVIVLVQIVGRWTGRAPAWAEEFARCSMVWIGFIVASMMTRTRSHLGVDIFVNMMPEKMRVATAYFSDVTIITGGAMMLWYGIYLTANNMDQILPAMRVPFAVMYLCVPIAGAMFILFSIESILKRMAGVAQ